MFSTERRHETVVDTTMTFHGAHGMDFFVAPIILRFQSK